ncbi:hypothetical protein HOP50_01g02120 [Chloropicon primus]|uniref:Uncharacterized protein n=1 Tax=Chloropicon primus TaxID=1764295 RepID=A0A5B8MCD6_9CHLO|nr:hypothetical protein A3770_01p02220 [Chloropicon primus]UPQ96921.1 hypothetical protein HOP50_01g02120 [Chloropicon primus]|eukprot:QDZ17704.1 hypothetical protein A3770_01p02220 [Chloropicon primus]
MNLENPQPRYVEIARQLLQNKLCDSDTLDEQLQKILESADNLTGPIKQLIRETEEGGRSRSYDPLTPQSFPSLLKGEVVDDDKDEGDLVPEFARTTTVSPRTARYRNAMGTPKSGNSSPGSMEALLMEQGYVTPENQKMESGTEDYSPASSVSARSTEDNSPKIPEDIEIAMRRKEMERFMKRVALKHKAMSPETRERIEKNRRNSVLGTGVTPRKEVGKSTKDFMGKSAGHTPGSGKGAAFASSKRNDLFKVDDATGAHNRHGRRGSIMDVLDPGGKSKQGSRGKIRRKSCIDMSKEVVQKEKTASKAKTKGWELDGKTPNRRASISVFKPLS